MVRPRKYKTKAQQRQALVEKTRRNYYKHRERILSQKRTKRMELKAKQDRALVKKLLGSMHKTSREELDTSEEKKAERYFDSILEGYRTELSSLFTETPLDFYDSLYQQTISWLDGGSSGNKPFSRLETQIQKLKTDLSLHMNKILNIFGANLLYQRFQAFEELVREHVTCVEELEYGQLVDGLIDEVQLHEKYRERKCAYQNPSLVPFLSGVKILA
ncbi:hypothetical protein PQX77_002150 [Marasmius sp. AFHP31]|nr:hypothetical protein PQX77_002150 [Marasmius sp. AFHP31]